MRDIAAAYYFKGLLRCPPPTRQGSLSAGGLAQPGREETSIDLRLLVAGLHYFEGVVLHYSACENDPRISSLDEPGHHVFYRAAL